MMMMFKGSISALITPMNTDCTIDFNSLSHIIELHKKHKTDALLILGTTGESPTITDSERLEIVKFVLQQTNKQIPVIVGNGSNSTSRAIAYTEELEQLKIDAMMPVTPFYNKPTQAGLIDYFTAITKVTSKPQIIYNVPSRTACDMSNETICKLSEIEGIIGCKEASGIPSRAKEIRNSCNQDFMLFSGDDFTFIDFIENGGNGVISVINNVFPKEIKEITDLALAGDITTSKNIFKKLHDICKSIYTESNPIPIKWLAMHTNLISTSSLRSPLTQLEIKHQQQIKNELEKLRQI